MGLISGALGGGLLGAGIGYASSDPGYGVRGAVMGSMIGAAGGGALGYGYSKLAPVVRRQVAAAKVPKTNRSAGGTVTENVAAVAGRSKQRGLFGFGSRRKNPKPELQSIDPRLDDFFKIIGDKEPSISDFFSKKVTEDPVFRTLNRLSETLGAF